MDIKEVIQKLRGDGTGEANRKYTTGNFEEWIHVEPLAESFLSIKAHLDSSDSRIKYLEKENEKLKDEHYKDKEIKKYQEAAAAAEANLRRGFGISEAEDAAIEEWIQKHEEKKHSIKVGGVMIRKSRGAIGGGYTYSFTPTSIGTIGVVRCSCGAEFVFSDL